MSASLQRKTSSYLISGTLYHFFCHWISRLSNQALSSDERGMVQGLAHIIVAQNITKYCIGVSFRVNLRPLTSLSIPRDQAGREDRLRRSYFSASSSHAGRAGGLSPRLYSCTPPGLCHQSGWPD